MPYIVNDDWQMYPWPDPLIDATIVNVWQNICCWDYAKIDLVNWLSYSMGYIIYIYTVCPGSSDPT